MRCRGSLFSQRCAQSCANLRHAQPGKFVPHRRKTVPVKRKQPVVMRLHRPAVTDRGEHLGRLHRAVGQTVDAGRVQGADAVGHIGAAAHDLVRSERAHERLVGFRGIGDHVQAGGDAEVHHVATEGAGRAGDGERRASRQGEQIEGEAGGHAVHRQGARLGVRRPGRHAHHRVARQHQRFRVATVGARRHDDPHGVVPDGHMPDPVADLVDDSGDVHAGHVRRRVLAQHLGPTAGSVDRVGRVHRSGTHGESDLTRASVAFRDVEEAQHLRPTELINPDHSWHVRLPHPPGPVDRRYRPVFPVAGCDQEPRLRMCADRGVPCVRSPGGRAALRSGR